MVGLANDLGFLYIHLNGGASHRSKKYSNLVSGGLARVVVSNIIADDAVFTLNDLLDFTFADVAAHTADGPVFDKVAGLRDALRILPGPQHERGLDRP